MIRKIFFTNKMEYYEANKGNPNILLRFLETKFVSKNNSIQQTFDIIFSHDTINYDELKSLHRSTLQRHAWRQELENKDYENGYAQLFDSIKKYNWKAVDTLFSEQYNIKEHFRIIFALLAKWYYLDQTISRLQYQNALGIQQARWALSSDNKFANFLFQGIKGDLLDFTLNQVKNIDKFPYGIESYLSAKNKLCFYQYSKNKVVYTANFKHNDTYHMAIPETFNLSKCANVYRPRLVLGSLTSCTLLKYMKQYGERPFVCHHPDLSDTNNSTHFDGITGMNVFEHWVHDARHNFTNALQSKTRQQAFDLDPSTITQQQCLKYNDQGYIYNPLNYQQQVQQRLQDSRDFISEFLGQTFENQLKIIKSFGEPLNLYSYLILQKFCEPIKPFINFFKSRNFLRYFSDFDNFHFSVFKDSFPFPGKKFGFDVEQAIRLLCDSEYYNYYNSFLDKLLQKNDAALKSYLKSFLTDFTNHLDLFEKAAEDLNKVEILEKILRLKQKLI
jgi:hypothetical protein